MNGDKQEPEFGQEENFTGQEATEKTGQQTNEPGRFKDHLDNQLEGPLAGEKKSFRYFFNKKGGR